MADEPMTEPLHSTGIPVDTLHAEVVDGPDKGMTASASSDTLTVGTSPGNDLVVTDQTASRYHLELRAVADRVLLVDHGSTNGTMIGDNLIERGLIQPDSVLKLGKTRIQLSRGSSSEIEVLDRDIFFGLRGRSPEMRRVMATAERVAKSNTSVLLVAETGSGKEVIARAIHDASPRASGPFEVVDCGALMPTLIASELFGHEKGAFTGAEQQHRGAFERARGGTLLLDEIGELPAQVQPALLGALERRRFRRVGGSDAIEADVRVICSTHRDLRREVNSNRFRQDLYFRIAVVTLTVPPLRERVEDIPLLIEHFLDEAGYDEPIENIVPASVLSSLKEHYWPGNVRELRNFVEATLALGRPGDLTQWPTGENDAQATDSPAELDQPYKDARGKLLNDFEVRYLEHLMQRSRHNVTEAARLSGMNRTYLTRLLKRHDIR